MEKTEARDEGQKKREVGRGIWSAREGQVVGPREARRQVRSQGMACGPWFGTGWDVLL